MRSKKRINLGLLAFILLSIGAIVYAKISDSDAAYQESSLMLQMMRLQDAEIAVITFPESDVADGVISAEEYDRAIARVEQYVKTAYASEALRQVRRDALIGLLESQIMREQYVVRVEIEWASEKDITTEDALIKIAFDWNTVKVDTLNQGKISAQQSHLYPGLAAIFQEQDGTLILQSSTMNALERFFLDEYAEPYAVEEHYIP